MTSLTAPTIAKIKVVANPGNPNNLDKVNFHLEERPQRFLYEQVINLDRAKWVSELPIKFTLEDNTGLGLRFPRRLSDAIWISRDHKNPTAPGNGGGGVPLEAIEEEQKVLKIRTLNWRGTQHKFTLRLIGRNSLTEYAEFDPVIVNKGGGGRGTSRTVIYVIVAVAVAVAAAFVADKLSLF